MCVLVTGGAGFVGCHVVAALVAAGHRVQAFNALLPAAHGPAAGWPRWLPDEAERVTGDVRDPGAVAAALASGDAVPHQTAMVELGVDLADLPAYVAVNDLGTAVLLAAMASAQVLHGRWRSGSDRRGRLGRRLVHPLVQVVEEINLPVVVVDQLELVVAVVGGLAAPCHGHHLTLSEGPVS